MEKKLLLVVAAALKNDAGCYLLCQRPEGKSLAGCWEFPGGKVEPYESPEKALCRELKEELGLAVNPNHLTPLTFASFEYPSFHLLMPLYGCMQWQNEPHGREGQEIAWVAPHDFKNYPMPPADGPLAEYLGGGHGEKTLSPSV